MHHYPISLLKLRIMLLTTMRTAKIVLLCLVAISQLSNMAVAHSGGMYCRRFLENQGEIISR